MTEQSPPGFETNASHGAKLLRQMVALMGGVGISGGDVSWPTGLGDPSAHPAVVMRPTHMKVTQSSGMVMSVAAGVALIQCSTGSDQGAYFAFNHGAGSVTLSAAPGAGTSRIDIVIAKVRDTEKNSGASDTWALDKVTGTAASSPSAPSLSGYEAANNLAGLAVLAYVTVQSNGTVSIVDARRVSCADGPPIGTLFDWGANSIPHGYLLCDGSSKAASDYPDLFEIIGYTHGGSAGNFNVPDLRGRVSVGPDSMNPAGSSAGAASVVTALGTSLGAKHGEEQHVLTEAEMPSHTHDMDSKDSSTGGTSARVMESSGTGTNTTFTTKVAGSDDPHNNMPPYIALNKIIRAY